MDLSKTGRLIAELRKEKGFTQKNVAENSASVQKPYPNVKRTKFYVCEKCGNILTSMGNAEIVCCGRKLSPFSPKT